MEMAVGGTQTQAEVAAAEEKITTTPKIKRPQKPSAPARTRLQSLNIDGDLGMIHTKLVSWALGIFFAISFVLCVIYGLLVPQILHMHAFLELVLPAFKWLSWWSFLLGLIESFLWGAYIGLVFCPVYNWLYRKFGSSRMGNYER